MICVSITEKNPASVIALANSAEMSEIRIDLCGLTEQTTAEVFSHVQKPAIATCRPDCCPDAVRLGLLKTAIACGAAYVDVEIESAESFKKEIIAFAHSKGCRCIISYHNYENTPSLQELKSIVDSCFAQHADIAKVATMAHTQEDCARVLSLYADYKNVVALAMGEEGKITRIANLYLGSPFSFAAVSLESATAKGQMTVEQMRDCKKILG
ncbi:MAG: type I 3-dehydroquinate dehydratase [Bacteroidales bacterium]|nr:type I 3-dehydroquinate dehydratase [Bacteroidales bacterium]